MAILADAPVQFGEFAIDDSSNCRWDILLFGGGGDNVLA